MNWTCNDSLYNAFVFVVRFKLYMFCSNLNYKFEFFLTKKIYCRAVLD